MSKDPYPSQIAPKPKSGKRNPNAIRDEREMAKKIKPAKKAEMGIMGSNNEQAQQRKLKMLADMRKRAMLRQKQGQ